MIKSLIPFALCFFMASGLRAQHYKELFSKSNPDSWYIYLQPGVGSQDPDSAFVLQSRVLYVTGKSVGYICTREEYGDFHLKLEFKWGKKKYEPRKNEKRDSGILYYFSSKNPDKIWPRTFECQVQEGDCGDFWLADSISLRQNGKEYTRCRVPKLKDAEKPYGEWNTMEVVAKNGKITHIVNGIIVNEGTDANVHNGKIALQTEAAEMYYRNVRVARL